MSVEKPPAHISLMPSALPGGSVEPAARSSPLRLWIFIISGILILSIIAMGGFFYVLKSRIAVTDFKTLLAHSTNTSREGRAGGAAIPAIGNWVPTTLPQTASMPHMDFAYPSILGSVATATSSSFQKITFSNATGAQIYVSMDTLIPGKTFPQWVAEKFGYSPYAFHSSFLPNDQSQITYTLIKGRPAAKVKGYINQPNNSLYLLQISDTRILILSILGAPLLPAAQSASEIMVRDNIASTFSVTSST